MGHEPLLLGMPNKRRMYYSLPFFFIHFLFFHFLLLPNKMHPFLQLFFFQFFIFYFSLLPNRLFGLIWLPEFEFVKEKWFLSYVWKLKKRSWKGKWFPRKENMEKVFPLIHPRNHFPSNFPAFITIFFY